MQKPKRSDQSIAIYGILAVTTVALIGLLVLLGLGREVPEALLTGVVLGGMTGVLGWARGGTYYEPDEERIPSPPVIVEPLPVAAPPLTGPDAQAQAHSGTPVPPPVQP